MLMNWNRRFIQPVEVCESAATIGSSIAMPTATRLLSPRNGMRLTLGAPGLRSSCTQPCFTASNPSENVITINTKRRSAVDCTMTVIK